MAACASSDGSRQANPPATLDAQVASYELLSDRENRFLLGIFTPDGLVSYGSVDLRFTYLGAEGDQSSPGPSLSAAFLPVPHEGGAPTEVTASDPAITLPTEAQGVYTADVTFDRPGPWGVQASVDLGGEQPSTATATFDVRAKPTYPAPGQPAPPSDNLVIGTRGAPATALDSRITGEGQPPPDPDLHRFKIAELLEAGEPAVVVVSTPTYCQSRFCGPVTDSVEQLATRHSDRARFIHLEVWRDFERKVVNRGAADWVYRGKELTEPWVFLVGADGKVVDRWQNVLDGAELEATLAELPPIGA